MCGPFFLGSQHLDRCSLRKCVCGAKPLNFGSVEGGRNTAPGSPGANSARHFPRRFAEEPSDNLRRTWSSSAVDDYHKRHAWVTSSSCYGNSQGGARRAGQGAGGAGGAFEDPAVFGALEGELVVVRAGSTARHMNDESGHSLDFHHLERRHPILRRWPARRVGDPRNPGHNLFIQRFKQPNKRNHEDGGRFYLTPGGYSYPVARATSERSAGTEAGGSTEKKGSGRLWSKPDTPQKGSQQVCFRSLDFSTSGSL